MRGFGGIGVLPAEFAWYEVFCVDPTNPARMISTYVFDDTIKQSVNGGDDWTPIPGLTSLTSQGGRYQFKLGADDRFMPNVSTISFCPDNNARILIGTHQGGAYFSFDGGRAWAHVDDS